MQKQQHRLRAILHEAIVIGLILTGILAARSTLADHYHVPSGSMEYSLLAGDRVVVDKRAYGLRIPFTNIRLTRGSRVERGDVVIFDSPQDGKRLIKRVVAVGGDRVVMRRGHLSINGTWLREERVGDTELIGDKRVELNLADGGGPELDITVPEGEVLAIGDHRGSSLDSRFFGTIPESDVYGRAIAVYFRANTHGDHGQESGLVWRSL